MNVCVCVEGMHSGESSEAQRLGPGPGRRDW